GGRTVDEWTPVVVAFVLRRLTGNTRFSSPLPTAGSRHCAKGGSWLPTALRGVQIWETAGRERPIGAICERGGRWLTSLLACRVASFALLDPDAQERRLARWGLVLSGAAGTCVRRI